MSSVTAEPSRLKLAFGRDRSGWFDAGLPVLAGEPVENLFGGAEPVGRAGAFALFRREDWLLGAACVATSPGLEATSHSQYLEMLHAVSGLNLARIWNYVPGINEPGPSGVENYRAFCRGRSLAFESEFGAGFKASVPAASAVGSRSAALTMVFAACRAVPRHVENPLQVPAYDYPAEYGPRAPSFARASIVPHPRQPTVFVSGTAAIRGHATVAPHCTRDQLDCVLENLHEISRACGLGADLAVGPEGARHFKVYIRHAVDQPSVAAILEKRLLHPGDVVSYLHADICRAPLNVEIEVTICRRPSAGD